MPATQIISRRLTLAPAARTAARIPPGGAWQLVRRLAHSSAASNASDGKVQLGKIDEALTEAEVLECQNKWAAAILACSAIYAEGGDYVGTAAAAAAELYGYGHGKVLFKPTKASQHPFRPTANEAMSYFVGGGAVGGYTEDAGFAINGGRGWEKLVFCNHAIDVHGVTATAMGEYTFTDATSKDEVKVEYTFVYKRCEDGKARICLHHSSLPYQPH